MVGESIQEMQLAGWLPAHSIGVAFPGFVGLWFATFPTVEGLAAQSLAALLVIGSYFLAERVRVTAPRARAERERRALDTAPLRS
jgi:high-affinity iron transporter